MSAYTRKTRDVYQVEQYAGPQYKWEPVCSESTRAEAKERRKEYRDNQPEYPVRIRRTRERIEALAQKAGDA